MDELVTMNWNFVWTGFPSHRLHCHLWVWQHNWGIHGPQHEDEPLKWSGQAGRLSRVGLCHNLLWANVALRKAVNPSIWSWFLCWSTQLKCSQTSSLFVTFSPQIGLERWKEKQRWVFFSFPGIFHWLCIQHSSWPPRVHQQAGTGSTLCYLTAAWSC